MTICIRRFLWGLLGVLAVTNFGAPLGWAEETTDSAGDRWTFNFTPYVWGTGLKGNIDTFPPAPSVSVNAKFTDIAKDLNLAFMGTGELRKGRFGILADVFWVKLSASADASVGLFFSGATLESETLMTKVAGAYRVAEYKRAWLDLIAGVRGYYVNNDLNLRAGLLLPSMTISNSTGWVDGLGELRGRVNICKGLYAVSTTLAGGGGSDIVMDLMGGVGYEFNRHISVIGGYRYAKVDYRKSSGFLWDVEYKGPFLGMGFTF